MRIILLGCPGAGKGTQAKFITQKYHIPQISTGDILRNAIQKNSELGRKVKAIVEKGELVPDDMVIELVKERLNESDTVNGFLLDGFPRTLNQAKALQKLTPIDYVIELNVSEDELVRRLSGRRIHPGSGRIYHVIFNPPKNVDKDDITGEALIQRPDDSEETVRKRLTIYQNQTSPLKDFYNHFQGKPEETQPLYVKIDGTGSVDEIKNTIFSILNGGNVLNRVD